MTITAEELAKFIAEKIDAAVIGDYDIEARADKDGYTVAVWADHQTKEVGTTFEITVEDTPV